MSELAIIILFFVAPLTVACSERRFIWSMDHELLFITNTGTIRSVPEVLQHEPFILSGYAVDFEDHDDRNLAVAVLKGHANGDDINIIAGELLPPGYEVCEQFCSHFEEIEEDEDGCWVIPIAECGICDAHYDLSEPEFEPDTEDSNEDEAEWESNHILVRPGNEIPSILDLIIHGGKTRGDA
ncbi:MAG: hypothetical protein ACPHUK_08200 [Candidatus Poseidoniaceae archaeon]